MFSTKLQRQISDYIEHKIERGESVEPDSPLFLSNRRRRISGRRVESMFKEVQRRAGFSRLFTFHSLRHTAITIFVDTNGGDLVAAQRFARHQSPETTRLYYCPSDQRLRDAVEALPY